MSEQSGLSDIVLKLSKQELIQYLTEQVVKKLIVKIPLAALGFFNPLVSFFVGKVISVLVNELGFGLYGLQVDKETHKEAVEYNEAAHKLAEAIKNGTEDDVKKAEQEKIDKFRKLVKIGGNAKLVTGTGTGK